MLLKNRSPVRQQARDQETYLDRTFSPEGKLELLIIPRCVNVDLLSSCSVRISQRRSETTHLHGLSVDQNDMLCPDFLNEF